MRVWCRASRGARACEKRTNPARQAAQPTAGGRSAAGLGPGAGGLSLALALRTPASTRILTHTPNPFLPSKHNKHKNLKQKTKNTVL
jgi:hypothetical protein